MNRAPSEFETIELRDIVLPRPFATKMPCERLSEI